MHLTFFGSSLVSSYWNGAATYYRGLLRSLAAHGHDIVFCEPDAFERQEHRDLPTDPEYARVVVYRTEEERDALVERALTDSDWVVKCSGVGVWDQELAWAVAAGSGRARRAYWDVDAPATLASLARPEGRVLSRCVPLFHHVFTYGGGPPVVGAYRKLGARQCTPVYNALDPLEHRPPERPEPERWRVLFMGNRLPDREERVRAFFFAAATAAPELRFALGGAGWEEVAAPENVELLGHVPTARHNRVNAAARLVLNIHRDSMVRNGWSPATRMFEAAGAAACQVSDPWRGVEDFFEPGRELLIARSGAEVAELAATTDERTAREIGEAALRRARAQHTYEKRAQLVDAVLRGRHPGGLEGEGEPVAAAAVDGRPGREG